MRFKSALAAVIAIGLFAPATMAEDAPLRPGWSFNLGAYLWLPTMNGTLNYALPKGIAGTADVSVDAGDYFSKLNFAALMAAEIRYENFSLITDLVHMDIGADSSRLRSVDVRGLPSNPLSTSYVYGRRLPIFRRRTSNRLRAFSRYHRAWRPWRGAGA